MKMHKAKKPFYKRPLIIIAIIVSSPVVAVALLLAYALGSHYLNYYIDASKLPPEERWTLKYLSDNERIEDMVENPEKYRKLSCMKVEILDDAYCFDRSRAANMSIYTMQQSGEFEAFKFSFVSEVLPTGKHPSGYEHVVNWVSLRQSKGEYYVTGDNGEALSTPHRMVHRAIVGSRADKYEREKYEKIYQTLMQNNNNQLVDITHLENFDLHQARSDERIYIEDNVPVAKVDLYTDEHSKNYSFKYMGSIIYAPAGHSLYMRFYFRTNYGVFRDEVRHRFIKLAKEIWQFLEDSKLTNQ